mmetsp:Transcript_44879/g.81890  ORF Transcript_44879/g.81890 Transcript_44879/m.81890 type:complete len:220 (+) Transcript_44879:2167-2826(+)
MELLGVPISWEELKSIFSILQCFLPLVQCRQGNSSPSEGLETCIGALLEALLKDLSVLNDLVAGFHCVLPAENLNLCECLVCPQSLVAAVVLQPLFVLFNGPNKVSLLHQRIAPLLAFLGRLCSFCGLFAPADQVCLHGLELRILTWDDGLTFILGVCVWLPIFPSLVVDVSAPPQQRLRLFPAQPLVLAPLVSNLFLLHVLHLLQELLPSLVASHHFV